MLYILKEHINKNSFSARADELTGYSEAVYCRNHRDLYGIISKQVIWELQAYYFFQILFKNEKMQHVIACPNCNVLIILDCIQSALLFSTAKKKS